LQVHSQLQSFGRKGHKLEIQFWSFYKRNIRVHTLRLLLLISWRLTYQGNTTTPSLPQKSWLKNKSSLQKQEESSSLSRRLKTSNRLVKQELWLFRLTLLLLPPKSYTMVLVKKLPKISTSLLMLLFKFKNNSISRTSNLFWTITFTRELKD